MFSNNQISSSTIFQQKYEHLSLVATSSYLPFPYSSNVKTQIQLTSFCNSTKERLTLMKFQELLSSTRKISLQFLFIIEVTTTTQQASESEAWFKFFNKFIEINSTHILLYTSTVGHEKTAHTIPGGPFLYAQLPYHEMGVQEHQKSPFFHRFVITSAAINKLRNRTKASRRVKTPFFFQRIPNNSKKPRINQKTR